MSTRLSIILVTHNSEGHVGTLTNNLSKLNDPDYEVIIVDNGSVDGTVSAIGKTQWETKLKVITLNKNFGPGYGWNVGAAVAKGEYLCIMDPDTIVHGDFFARMVEKYSKCDSGVGAITPVFLSLDGKRLNDFGPVNLELPMDVEARMALGDLQVLFPTGACFVTRKKIFEEVGGFDKDIFWDFVDADYGWRLTIAGFEVISTNAATAYHRDFTVYHSFRYFHYVRDLLVMQLKDWGPGTVTYAIPFSVARYLYSITRRQFPYETFHAIIDVFRGLPFTLQKRRQIQSRRRKSDGELMRVLWFLMPVPWIRNSWREALRESRRALTTKEQGLH